MREVKIFLGTIERVKDFVNAVTRLDCDMDIVSGRYVIDAEINHGNFQCGSVKSGRSENSCRRCRSRKSDGSN